MGRMYVVQQWQNAAEYSGEQIGNRLKSSQGIYLPNGQANTALFADDEKPKRKAKSAYESICLADSLYSRLEKQLLALEIEHEKGLISWDDYVYARKIQEKRMAKTWGRIEKLREWDKEEKEIDNSSVPALSYKHRNKENFMSTVSDDNMFKKGWTKVEKCVRIVLKIKKAFNVAKEEFKK